MGNIFVYLEISSLRINVLLPPPLQDFTVLPMEKFRRCVIRSSSVIFLPTSSPTEYVRRLYLRWWFPIPSVYQSEKQKNHLPTVLQTESARQKKRFPLEIYRRIFIPSVTFKLPTENIRRYIGRWMYAIPTEYVRL
jgi:hypothetical protein